MEAMDRTERGSVSHTTAASLIGVAPAELERLVQAGVVRRNDSNAYAATSLIKDYIAFIKTGQTAAKLTQADIAQHLDLAERTVRELLTEWGIDHRTTSLDDIRVRYIRKLREVAAGRASSGDLDLVQERAALARSQRIAQDLKNATARGEYAPVGLLADVLGAASAAVVDRFEQLEGDIAKACPELPEAARRVIISVIASARNEWIRSTAALVDRALDDLPDADDEGMPVELDMGGPDDSAGLALAEGEGTHA